MRRYCTKQNLKELTDLTQKQEVGEPFRDDNDEVNWVRCVALTRLNKILLGKHLI